MGLLARQSFSRDSIVSSVMGDLSPVTNNETASLEFSPLQHIINRKGPVRIGIRSRVVATCPLKRGHLQGSSARYRTVTLVTVSNPFNGLRRFSKIQRALMRFSLRRFKAFDKSKSPLELFFPPLLFSKSGRELLFRETFTPFASTSKV